VSPATQDFTFNQASGLFQFDFLALFEASIEANADLIYTITIHLTDEAQSASTDSLEFYIVVPVLDEDQMEDKTNEFNYLTLLGTSQSDDQSSN
jgi:hypothetical protein